jgi:hypothetical protein
MILNRLSTTYTLHTVTVTTYSYLPPKNFSHKKDDMRYGSAAKNKPQVSGSMYDSFLRYVFFICRSGIDDNVKRDLSMLFSGRRRLKTWLIWCLKSTSFVCFVLLHSFEDRKNIDEFLLSKLHLFVLFLEYWYINIVLFLF